MKEIRQAVIDDLRGVMECINDAKKFLKESGSNQWNGMDGYPNVSDLVNDIKLNRLYIYTIENKVAGIAAFLGEEPEYKHPYGKWLLNTKDYLTIHRIAVNQNFRGKGIAKALFLYAEEYARLKHKDSIRVDTHEKNVVMQSLVQKMGYTPCGYVVYQRIQEEPKRLIYEKKII